MWLILRKDLILLWPVVALCTFVQFDLNALMFVADRTPESQYLLLTARLFVLVVFLAIALTISLGAHQDPIPGTRQDWLVRPIRRRDLLLAKLLFVLAAVQLPMLLGDLLEIIAQGFSLRDALVAALSRNLYFFVAVSLPALGIAAMTRTTAHFIGVGIVYFIAIGTATFLLNAVARIGGAEQATNPLAWTGVAWVPQWLARSMLAAGTLIALFLLYIRRRIALGRYLFSVFAAASAMATFLPWGWIFAAEQATTVAPTGPNDLMISFDPAAPRYRPATGESLADYAAGMAQVELRGRAPGEIADENRTRRPQGDVTVFIPVRIAGLPLGSLPWVDRATVILRRRSGRVVFQGRGDDLEFEGTQSGSSPALAYEAIRIPELIYEAVRNTGVSMEIDYSLSVLRPRQEVAIAALNGRSQLSGFGHCTTDMDSDGSDVQLHCLKPGDAPSCISATLNDPATGRRNPETRICAPDYSPYDVKLFPDAITRFEVEAPFRDRLQLANYPVGSAQLARARMVLTRYDAAQHLSHHLTATQVRLAAWSADTGHY